MAKNNVNDLSVVPKLSRFQLNEPINVKPEVGGEGGGGGGGGRALGGDYTFSKKKRKSKSLPRAIGLKICSD